MTMTRKHRDSCTRVAFGIAPCIKNCPRNSLSSSVRLSSNCIISTRSSAIGPLHVANRMEVFHSNAFDIRSELTSKSLFYDLPSNMILTAQGTSEQKTFEAISPDSSILIGFGFVVLLCVVAAFVWANEVVPVSRTKLALSKRDGEVKKYLDELKEGVNIDTNNDDSNIEIIELTDIPENDNMVKKKTTDGRDFERWLFTDWLENNKSAGKPGRKKEPALPILKSAKWNSGDNPVLVTFALMMVGVFVAAVTERTGVSF